ncbi:MAG: hypothetical protein Q8N61_01625 [bacterium]|nr:hypothetical protein [bacterium]
MKFKVFKVTPDEKQTLEYQLEVKDADGAVDYVLGAVHHQVSQAGIAQIPDSDGVHLTKWLRLDEKDTYWFIPGGRFKKQPTPIVVGGGK